jgi:hypothetical protein
MILTDDIAHLFVYVQTGITCPGYMAFSHFRVRARFCRKVSPKAITSVRLSSAYFKPLSFEFSLTIYLPK